MNEFVYDSSKYQKIPEKITELLIEYLGNKFKYASYYDTFENLEIDSLDVIELVMAIEAEYNIIIADCEVEKCSTIGDIIELIKTKTNGEF